MSTHNMIIVKQIDAQIQRNQKMDLTKKLEEMLQYS